MKLGGPAASGPADRLGAAIFWRPRPIGMDLDDGAVYRHRLDLDAHHLLPLELLEDLVQRRNSPRTHLWYRLSGQTARDNWYADTMFLPFTGNPVAICFCQQSERVERSRRLLVTCPTGTYPCPPEPNPNLSRASTRSTRPRPEFSSRVLPPLHRFGTRLVRSPLHAWHSS